MKALITGASGFLGSWLVRDLAQRGVDVRVLVRKSEGPAAESIEQVQGDVTDRESLIRAASGVDLVFHLAGVVGYSKAQRAVMERVNVQGTQFMVEACLQARVQRLVHVSSVAAIGASFDGAQPLNEDSPFNLGAYNLGYFETKRRGEEIVRKAVREQGLDAVILNPSTIYGAGDAAKGSRGVQLKVARGQFPFYTSGGVSVVAVEDVVEALWSASQRGRRGERYILCGENITIEQVFRTIAELAGVKPPPYYLPNPVVRMIGWVGDRLESWGKKGALNSENAITSLLFHWFDHSKATRELGFNPRPAREALAASVGWMKSSGRL